MTARLEIRYERFSYGALKAGMFMVGVGLGLLLALYLSGSYGLVRSWDLCQSDDWRVVSEHRGLIVRNLMLLYSCSVLICGSIGLLTAFVLEYRVRRKRNYCYYIED